MKFTLTIEGSLPPSANKSKAEGVWKIREHFNPQFLDLWKSHPALKTVMAQRMFPDAGGTVVLTGGRHSSAKRPRAFVSSSISRKIDLCAPIEKHGVNFLPLNRETFALHCGLKVISLHK